MDGVNRRSAMRSRKHGSAPVLSRSSKPCGSSASVAAEAEDTFITPPLHNYNDSPVKKSLSESTLDASTATTQGGSKQWFAGARRFSV